MIKVSALHESRDGKKFDIDYYCNTHIPLIRQKLGAACRGIEVDMGLSSAQLGSSPPFIVMVHMLFDSVDAFREAYGPHAAWAAQDRANFTDSPPLLQISKVSA